MPLVLWSIFEERGCENEKSNQIKKKWDRVRTYWRARLINAHMQTKRSAACRMHDTNVLKPLIASSPGFRVMATYLETQAAEMLTHTEGSALPSDESLCKIIQYYLQVVVIFARIAAAEVSPIFARISDART